MKKVTINQTIHQIELPDYNKSGYHHMPCNSKNREALFSILTNPEITAIVISCVKAIGNSPIRYYDSFVKEAIAKGELAPLSKSDRQFAGAVACVIMESNGFAKTGNKDRITKKDRVFTQAEIYRLIS